MQADVSITSNTNRGTFYEGLKDGIPIAAGYISVAIAFGMLSKSLNINSFHTAFMSIIVFAGGSQFASVNLIALGTSTAEVLLTVFIINFRHFLMSMSLLNKLDSSIPRSTRALMSFFVTDETYSVAYFKGFKINTSYFFGLCLISYVSWNIGTIFGIYLSSIFGEMIGSSLNIALYAMFISLLVPSVKKSKPALFVSILAASLSITLTYIKLFEGLSSGWIILISTFTAALTGAILFRKSENNE